MACAMMEVTYEFTVSSTTSVMNSLMLMGDYTQGRLTGSSSDFMRASVTFDIPEPTTITFYPQQSAMRMYMHDSGPISGLNVRTGSEVSFTSGYSTGLGVVGGSSVLQRVFPSGDTLARGSNTLTADTYNTSSTNTGTGITTLFILNYVSGVHTIGGTKTPGAHNQTTQWRLGGNSTEATSNVLYTASTAPVFSEDYYLTQVSVMEYVYIDFSAGGGLNWGDIVLAEITTGESGGAAPLWQEILTASIYTDPECGLIRTGVPVRDLFRMWTGDARPNRRDIENARVWRMHTLLEQNTEWRWLRLLITHHDIERTVAGTVSGWAGDGSGITVGIHDATSGELLRTAVTAAGGTYTTVWWDDLDTIYAEARQDATHVGRSNQGSAV